MGNPNVKECRQCKHHCTVNSPHDGACFHYCKVKEEYVAAYRTVKFYRDLRCKYFEEDENLEDDDELTINKLVYYEENPSNSSQG